MVWLDTSDHPPTLLTTIMKTMHSSLGDGYRHLMSRSRVQRGRIEDGDRFGDGDGDGLVSKMMMGSCSGLWKFEEMVLPPRDCSTRPSHYRDDHVEPTYVCVYALLMCVRVYVYENYVCV